MIDVRLFVKYLESNGIHFFVGVPDSYLNSFCKYICEKKGSNNIIAANEGNAIGIAAGYYLSTGKVPMVYMQNSGLGNALNPLLSLADSNVYGIPMVLLIGWRGEPGTGDHPQHIRQGEVTTSLLDICGIKYVIADENNIKIQLEEIVSCARSKNQPVAIIIRKGVLASTEKDIIVDDSYPLSREQAIEALLDLLPVDSFFGATTGRATRELYYLRRKRKEKHSNDYLNVGSMGHTSSVLLGMSIEHQNRLFVCLDGDAAVLMHMGALAIIGEVKPRNYLHVVLNNGSHESVGGQPSAGFYCDFIRIAEGAGYKTYEMPVTNVEELKNAIHDYYERGGPYFVEMRIHKGLGKLQSLNVSYNELKLLLMNELKTDKNEEKGNEGDARIPKED